MNTIPQRLDLKEIQQSLRDIWGVVNSLVERNIDLNGKRVINAGDSVQAKDYVTKHEVEKDYGFAQLMDKLEHIFIAKDGLDWKSIKLTAQKVKAITVSDIDNPTELGSLAGQNGDLVLCQEVRAGSEQDFWILFAYDEAGPDPSPAIPPYNMAAAGGSTKRWIAIAGNFSNLNTHINNTLELSGSVAGVWVDRSSGSPFVLFARGGTVAGQVRANSNTTIDITVPNGSSAIVSVDTSANTVAVAGSITVTGNVDGVDVGAHTHSGTGVNGPTIPSSSVTGLGTIVDQDKGVSGTFEDKNSNVITVTNGLITDLTT